MFPEKIQQYVDFTLIPKLEDDEHIPLPDYVSNADDKFCFYNGDDVQDLIANIMKLHSKYHLIAVTKTKELANICLALNDMFSDGEHIGVLCNGEWYCDKLLSEIEKLEAAIYDSEKNIILTKNAETSLSDNLFTDSNGNIIRLTDITDGKTNLVYDYTGEPCGYMLDNVKTDELVAPLETYVQLAYPLNTLEAIDLAMNLLDKCTYENCKLPNSENILVFRDESTRKFKLVFDNDECETDVLELIYYIFTEHELPKDHKQLEATVMEDFKNSSLSVCFWDMIVYECRDAIFKKSKKSKSLSEDMKLDYIKSTLTSMFVDELHNREDKTDL